MKILFAILAVLAAALMIILGALNFWMFTGKWSGYRWSDYLQEQACIPLRVPGGKGGAGNQLELSGENPLVPYRHVLSLWSCKDGRMVAVYEGLGETAPVRLIYEDMLRYRHGLLSGDDSHRFVTARDLAGLKTLRDWDGIVARDSR